MSRLGLSDLEAVAAVARHKSFRAAAAELGASRSALSHGIAALEQRLGVRLFHRTTRSVALAPAGERFLARVAPALKEIAEAMREADDAQKTPSGVLRLNTSAVAAELVLLPLVATYLRRFPQMKVEISTDLNFVDIVARGFDAGVRSSDAVPHDMVAVPCSGPVSWAVVGSPAYFKRHPPPRSPVDLRRHDCIRRRWPSGALYRWEFERRGVSEALEVAGSLTLDDDRVMHEAALAGLGLAYLSDWSVAADLKAKRLVRVLQPWTPSYPGVSLYYPGHRHVPAGLKAFTALIREQRARPTS